MSTITVSIDSNEQGTSRIASFANVLADDARFSFGGYKSLDVDLRFEFEPGWIATGQPNAYFNVELKECSDYLASAFNATGHLYQQILSMRESGNPGMVLILGGDAEVSAAIKDSVYSRYHKPQERAWNIASMEDRLVDFEARSCALGIPVMRWKTRPWKRLLSHAHKILTGANLLDYRPRPAEGERELAAASILFKGIGPITMSEVLKDYRLCFVPKHSDSRQLKDIPGIGKTRAKQIAEKVVA